ncbi:unnamed protein product, partial [Discosporangium mesarthrocarpum]
LCLSARLWLCLWWVLVLVAVTPSVPFLARGLGLRKSAARKIFHFMATVMFLPAVACEVRVCQRGQGARGKKQG